MANVYPHTNYTILSLASEIWAKDHIQASWILSKVGFRATVTLLWPISICVSNLTQISSLVTDIWPKTQIQEGRCHHLKFYKNLGFWATITRVWPISICVPNLMQISLLASEIWPKIQIQDSGCRHLEFYQNWYFRDSITPVWPLSICIPNLTQISSSATELWPKIQIQDSGHSYLEFYESGILCLSDPRMVNIYPCTKLDTNIFIDDWDMVPPGPALHHTASGSSF